jgi:hypothetical protein
MCSFHSKFTITLKKLKVKLPYVSAISLLGIYPKERKSGYNKVTCTPMFITAFCTIANLWEKPRCSRTDGCIKSIWYIHIYNGTLFTIKSEIRSLAGLCMDLENIILSDFSYVQKPKVSCFLSYMEYRPNTNIATLWKTGYTKGKSLTGKGG